MNQIVKWLAFFLCLWIDTAFAATRTISPVGGNWSATTAWVEAVVPTAADNVVATALSGNLTIDGTSGSPSLARSVDFTSYTGTLTQASGKELDVGDGSGGNFILVSGMTYVPNSASILKFIATTTGNTITSAGKAMCPCTFDGVGGAWTISDDLTSTRSITMTNGSVTTATTLHPNAIVANGGTFTLGGNLTLASTLQIAGGTVTGTGFTIAGTAITASSGTLNIKGFSGTGSVGNTGATLTFGTSGVSGTSLSLSAGNTTTSGAATSTTGSVAVSGTGNFDATGQTVTSATSISMSSSGSFNAGALSAATSLSTTAGTTTITGNVGATTWTNNGSTTRVVNMGSGTWTFSGTGTVLNATATGLTLTPQTSTLSYTDASASTKTFTSPGLTFNNITIAGAASAGAFTIAGSNTFNNVTFQPSANIRLTSATTTTLSSLTATGASGQAVKINASSAGTAATLSRGTGTISEDWLSLKDIATTGGAAWYAGANSINTSGNSGWIFATKPPSGQGFTTTGM